MTDTQRQKLRGLSKLIGEWPRIISAAEVAEALYDALRVIAEEDLSDTAKVAADIGNARDGYTEALLKRLVETGVDPKTLVVKSQMKDGVYKTWVEQEEPVSDADELPAPLNAPPPDDMPCYASDHNIKPWLVYGHQTDAWRWWQPCFVPLDATPGSAWVLWDEGTVSHFDERWDWMDEDDTIAYLYTVEES